MAEKRYAPEQVVRKLREAEVELGRVKKLDTDIVGPVGTYLIERAILT